MLGFFLKNEMAFVLSSASFSVNVSLLSRGNFLSFSFSFSDQQRDNDSLSGESGDEIDPFNDPDDKWEKDFKLDSSSSRFVGTVIFLGSLGYLAPVNKQQP